MNYLKYIVPTFLIVLINVSYAQDSEFENIIKDLGTIRDTNNKKLPNLQELKGEWSLKEVYTRSLKRTPEQELELIRVSDDKIYFKNSSSSASTLDCILSFSDADTTGLEMVEIDIKADNQLVYLLVYYNDNKIIFRELSGKRLRFRRYLCFSR